MDRRLTSMRLAALVLGSLAIACGFGADATGDGTGDTGTAMDGSSTGGDASSCGAEKTNSLLIEGECFCEPGFIWADPFNPFGYQCETPNRVWPACPRTASEAPGACKCPVDPEPPPAETICGEPFAAMSSSKTQCVYPDVYTCECPVDDDGNAACSCPDVLTCRCPEYFTWCSYEILADLSCCYDPAQDPDGSHAPSSDGSTTAADTTAGSGSSGDSSSGGTSSAGTGSTGGASETTG